MRDYAELISDLRRHHCDAKEDDTQEVCEECAYDVIVADKSKFNGITDVCTCGLMHRAADAIEELLAELTTIRKQLPRWISVEKPPNDERNVFICHGNADFKAPCIGHYDASMKRFYEDKNWFASPIYDAMFWCEMPKLPLPAPPKGVE